MIALGLSVQVADDGVVLRAQFDPRDVLDAHDPAVRSRANDDLLELLGRRQPALRPHRVTEFLPLRRGLAADLTGRIHGVLRLNRRDDFGHGDRQLRQLVRLHPQPHRVLARAEDLNAADAGNAGQLIVEVDVGVVRQELRSRRRRWANTG